MKTIQWYPGHMTKSVRMMKENLALVDVVIELVDARIPFASKNPDIDELARNKQRVLVLNKFDLADPAVNEEWVQYYEQKGFHTVMADSIGGKGVQQTLETGRKLLKAKQEAQKKRGRLFVPLRAMVVGIPNVGKSTYINKLVGKASAKTGDSPGVTKGKQWIRLRDGIELLDTPGILWPKFEDQRVGSMLAYTGAINDQILDITEIACAFLEHIGHRYPNAVLQRYQLSEADAGVPPDQLLEAIGKKRGFLKKGGIVDIERASYILLDEYRGGKLGLLSLERPDDLLVHAEGSIEN